MGQHLCQPCGPDCDVVGGDVDFGSIPIVTVRAVRATGDADLDWDSTVVQPVEETAEGRGDKDETHQDPSGKDPSGKDSSSHDPEAAFVHLGRRVRVSVQGKPVQGTLEHYCRESDRFIVSLGDPETAILAEVDRCALLGSEASFRP
mmetsp:Transcript_31562/g.69094  ORF Transcript_31562/g.69094 Transcript_31562/m.69094 type:complete len:147 (-) Transcript_31562:96-536(-)